MAGRFRKDHLILYSSITVIFLIHWLYNDVFSYPDQLVKVLLSNVWEVIYVVGVNLLYFEYVLPFAISVKINRIVSIVSSIALHILVFAIGLYAWRYVGSLMGVYTFFKPYTSETRVLLASLRITPGYFLLFAVIKLFFDYTQLKYQEQQARLETKQAELLFLRSQINPHFLFNTLNNIYSLSQYEPHLVSESVLRLSKILRYLLYETSIEFITIDKEIKILTDYIDLEKLRYSETVSIDFNYEIDNFDEMIPPLLLIPLVENAFKHGVSVSRGKRFVEVKCVLKNKNLEFVVNNSSHTGADYEETKDNIGLSNLKRRLALLYKSFDLATSRKESVFTAVLKIDLSSHV